MNIVEAYKALQEGKRVEIHGHTDKWEEVQFDTFFRIITYDGRDICTSFNSQYLCDPSNFRLKPKRKVLRQVRVGDGVYEIEADYTMVPTIDYDVVEVREDMIHLNEGRFLGYIEGTVQTITEEVEVDE